MKLYPILKKMSESISTLSQTYAEKGHKHAASYITSGTFGSNRIADNAITSTKLASGSVTEAALSDNSVTYAKLDEALANYIGQNLLTTQRFDLTVSVGKSASAGGTANIAKEGWTPLGIVGYFNGDDKAAVRIVNAWLSASTTASVTVWNSTTSNKSVACVIYVLYVRNI